MATVKIKLDVEVHPAHVLGRRHSTVAEIGVLRTTADTKADAIAQITHDMIAAVAFHPTYLGGEVTRRVYALRCVGQSRTSGGTLIYSWEIAILDPARAPGYIGCGGYCFGTATEREARRILTDYVKSCESAHESARDTMTKIVNTGS